MWHDDEDKEEEEEILDKRQDISILSYILTCRAKE